MIGRRPTVPLFRAVILARETMSPPLSAVPSLYKAPVGVVVCYRTLIKVSHRFGRSETVVPHEKKCGRSDHKWLTYILKDNLFVSSPGFDPKLYLEARGKKTSVTFAHVAGEMVSGKTIADVNAVSPGFVLQHLPKLKSYRAYLDDTGGDPLLDFPPIGDWLGTFDD